MALDAIIITGAVATLAAGVTKLIQEMRSKSNVSASIVLKTPDKSISTDVTPEQLAKILTIVEAEKFQDFPAAGTRPKSNTT